MKYENFTKSKALVKNIDELLEIRKGIENSSSVDFATSTGYSKFGTPLDANKADDLSLLLVKDTKAYQAKVVSVLNAEIEILKGKLEKL